MSSRDSSGGQEKHGLRHTIRAGFKSVKGSARGSASPHLLSPSGQSERLEPSLGSRFMSIFGRSSPALIAGPPASESDRQAATPSPGPSTQVSAPESKDDTAIKSEKPRSLAWNRLENSLHILEGTVELFPPLKSAVGALIGCLDVVQAAASNRTDYERLAEEFQSMADMLNQYAEEFESEPRNGSIANIAQCIQRQVEDIKRKEERGTTGKLLGAIDDQEEVIRLYRQVDRLFRQLQSDLSMRTKSNVKKHFETTLLRGMSPVGDAKYNSSYSTTIRRHGCTAETRQAIHKSLQEWTTNANSHKIYWMNGMAGTGKTTIAYSFCEWLESTNRLGASFFCSRISSTCRSLSQIVPSLAYQLAHFSPAFRSTVCRALNDNPDAGDLNVGQQFEKLINKPMLDAKVAIPDGVVIVIDALDECDDAFSVRLLLDVLLKFAEHLPLKFFVASRPEHAIRDRMMSQGGATRSIVHLHDIERSIVEEDIKKYLTEALSTMSPPPAPMQIHILAKRAGKLFIYAATVVRYINPEVIPVESSSRLEVILMQTKDPGAEGDNIYEDLDRLYTTVLNAVFSQSLAGREKDRMKRVLWTVVCAKEPITAGTIASLSRLTEPQVCSALQSLRSVLHVPEESGLISALHASFPEYMLDQSRSKELYCDELQSNNTLVHRCFEVMESELRFNICNLESSYLTNDRIPDLETRVSGCISPTLSYACRYWGQHLIMSPTLDQTKDMISKFLFNQLLFWMEVLSLSGYIGVGAPILQRVQSWLQKMGSAQAELQKRVSESRNFVTWFAANLCSRSTPHIYVSALPLCARSNWVYQHYSKRMQGLVNILSKRDDAVLAIWSTESVVESVAISPNGDRLAAGSTDGSIHIYDIHTGAIIVGPFKGHKNQVYSVAFSPDGTQIASGSDDRTAIIWDPHTGSVVFGPLHEHTSSVWSVAFSPDGNRLVTGGTDKIIIWYLPNGVTDTSPVHLTVSSESIRTVAFSPDGKLIVSDSEDNSIRLWDANTGAAVGTPFEGHTNIVWTVAFSSDGAHIASGSQDKTIRVWNVQTGTIVGPPIEGDRVAVGSVAYSPDGTLLASTGGGVTVWDTRSLSPIIGPLGGFSGWGRSVVFSPDSTRVVSGAGNNIHIWDVQPKDTTAHQPNTHDTSFGPVAFFPDSTRFVSISASGELWVWDLRTGKIISQPFEEQTDLTSIDSIAISRQGTHVATCTDNFIVRVWNTITGEVVCQSLTAHKGTITCIAFSPDGGQVCSGSEDTTIIVWDIESGTMTGQPYVGHEGAIHSVAYSQDGTHLASGAADHTIRIWDLTTRTMAYKLDGHEGPVLSVVFSPEGNQVISSSADESIRKWVVRSGESSGVLFGCSDRPVIASRNSDRNSDSISSVQDSNASGSARCMCLSPDGTRLIAGFDSTIRIIDTQTTDIISSLSLGEDEVAHWVGFSPDGTDILSVSASKKRVTQIITEESSGEPPQPPNIIRLWRSSAHSDQQGSSDNTLWSYKDDGRVISPDGLLLWVPPDLVPLLEGLSVSPSNPFVFSSDGVIDFGYKDLCIGDRWTECYIHQD